MLTPPADNPILEAFNRLEPDYATQTILPCNGSHAWAIGMVNLRPFQTVFDLTCTADRVWQQLPPADWQQAFDSHPRIGESHIDKDGAKAATAASLAMSATEQSTANPDAATQAALAAANLDYEKKFGRIFIVCATGKSAAEMLTILQHRLSNDPATELKEAAEQQRQITQIRLRKWLHV